jgi:uncharacterized membrane protein SpoIIM required for sporulation
MNGFIIFTIIYVVLGSIGFSKYVIRNLNNRYHERKTFFDYFRNLAVMIIVYLVISAVVFLCNSTNISWSFFLWHF